MCDVLQLLYSQPLGLVQLQQHCLIASPSQLHRLLIFYDILTSSASNDCSDWWPSQHFVAAVVVINSVGRSNLCSPIDNFWLRLMWRWTVSIKEKEKKIPSNFSILPGESTNNAFFWLGPHRRRRVLLASPLATICFSIYTQREQQCLDSISSTIKSRCLLLSAVYVLAFSSDVLVGLIGQPFWQRTTALCSRNPQARVDWRNNYK